MRASLGGVAVAVIGAAVGACGGSPTAAAQCDDHTTTAAFADVESFAGTVTSVAFANASSTAEIVHVSVRGSAGSADFTMVFAVGSATAVFERTGNAPPTAASACRLALGEQVQLPFSLISGGFGDFVPVEGEPAPPPPTVEQIVIVR
jgi:hypothetical protein